MEIIRNIINESEKLDSILVSECNLSFLSAEGRILCNAINMSGSMFKAIASHSHASHRTAYNCIKKLEIAGFVKKLISDQDSRSVVINVDFDGLARIFGRK